MLPNELPRGRAVGGARALEGGSGTYRMRRGRHVFGRNVSCKKAVPRGELENDQYGHLMRMNSVLVVANCTTTQRREFI